MAAEGAAFTGLHLNPGCVQMCEHSCRSFCHPEAEVCGHEHSSLPCWVNVYSNDTFLYKKENHRVFDMSWSDLLCSFGSLAPIFSKE